MKFIAGLLLLGASVSALALPQDPNAGNVNAETQPAKPATGQLGDAVQVLDNPQGAAYTAVIPAGKFGTMRGTVTAVATQGNGTQFNINFSGLPSTGGPFLYHIHVNPIPSNGSCASTLAHLDPYIRGEATPCVPEFPETCQVGDLSGKHGKPNATTFNATYIDPYVSLIDGQGAFFGNRSFVIHLADKTRIACANFFPIDNLPSEPSASGFPYGPSNSSSTTAPTFSVPVPPVPSETSASRPPLPAQTTNGASVLGSGLHHAFFVLGAAALWVFL